MLDERIKHFLQYCKISTLPIQENEGSEKARRQSSLAPPRYLPDRPQTFSASSEAPGSATIVCLLHGTFFGF